MLTTQHMKHIDGIRARLHHDITMNSHVGGIISKKKWCFAELWGTCFPSLKALILQWQMDTRRR